ncbi:type VI secretion system-associated protein [Photobacterium jeanii]|uniref:Type VI secretion system-associated protein n=1 Tax=Photobacterium jeanii TaxID=858640 RepID=A0A178K158_9GAMM|nr:type VI secretion system-associated protein TagF [Photobacterium jeanii]OAN11058.1 type VI secretion system-associated protein [Photobacterium jeanii]
MPDNIITPGFGYFGKVPQRGDFIQDKLSANFISSWSEWLQASVAVSREQLEEAWQEYYMTGPIWHFGFSAGVCGEKALIGSLMPSVDSVGRQFFFSQATVIDQPPLDYWLDREWSVQSEEHILQVLDDEVDLGEWVEKTKQACWHHEVKPPASPISVLSQSSEHCILSEPVDANLLLHHAYQQQYGRYCLWWTSGSEYVPECSVISNGLPLVSQFSAFLDGRWEQWGW